VRRRTPPDAVFGLRSGFGVVAYPAEHRNSRARVAQAFVSRVYGFSEHLRTAERPQLRQASEIRSVATGQTDAILRLKPVHALESPRHPGHRRGKQPQGGNRMQKLTFSLAFIVGLVSSQLFADQVVLKNGDKLTGAIVDSDGKTLTLKSDSVGQVQDSKFVGEVKIQWDSIQSITSSQPLAVTSKDGKVLTGNVTTKDSTFDVQTPTSGEVGVAKDVVAAVRSKEQQSIYEEETYRKEHPRLRDFWGGAINTGLAIARGNTETLSYNLSAKAVRDA